MTPKQFLAWRKAAALSQPGAAHLLGVSAKSIQRYEKGESPIPERVAAATIALSAPASDVAVAPPFPKNPKDETPWTHPHLFRRAPGKKHRWERITPGEPLADPEVYRAADRAVQVEEELKALEPLPDTIDWDDDVDGEHAPDGDDQ